jgi:hypothetical protein
MINKKEIKMNLEKLNNAFAENYKIIYKVKDQIDSFLDKHNYKDGPDAEYFLHLFAQFEEEVCNIIKESNPNFDKDKFQNRIISKTFKN